MRHVHGEGLTICAINILADYFDVRLNDVSDQCHYLRNDHGDGSYGSATPADSEETTALIEAAMALLTTQFGIGDTELLRGAIVSKSPNYR